MSLLARVQPLLLQFVWKRPTLIWHEPPIDSDGMKVLRVRISCIVCVEVWGFSSESRGSVWCSYMMHNLAWLSFNCQLMWTLAFDTTKEEGGGWRGQSTVRQRERTHLTRKKPPCRDLKGAEPAPDWVDRKVLRGEGVLGGGACENRFLSIVH